MEKPVFLLGSHKSGTSLLRSLLDGANEFFVVPLETHFFQYSGYWVDYALRRALPAKLSFDQVLDNFIRHIQRSNETVSQTSDSVLAGYWDVDRFATHLRITAAPYFHAGDMRGLFDSYVAAVHVGIYGTPLIARRFVEKSVENAEYAAVLKQLYPDARFIHILRNPYATLVSLRRHMTRGHYPFLGRALASLYNSHYYLYKNPLLIPDYKVIRYEKLVVNPEAMMRDLAEFLEIKFAEALLEPTTMGVPWQGNSTSGERFQGVSTQPLSAWRHHIQPLEIAFVNKLFAHVLRDYGYDRLEVDSSIFRPAPGEDIRSYVANRVLWQLVARTTFLFT